MKIGIDARLWNQTGVGRYIRNLVWQLQKIDTTNQYVLFVTSNDYSDINSQIDNHKNWKIVKADIRWHSLAEQIKLPRILEKEKLDLMHFPYFSLPVFYRGKFIVTIHDLIINHFATGKASTLPLPFYYAKRFMYHRVLNFAVSHAQKIIVPLHAVKDDVIKTLHISAQKIVVTEEGSDLSSLRGTKKSYSSLEQKNRLPRYARNDNKYFLYVGNAYPHKNLDTLINAFEAYKKETDDDISLLLVGKDDYFYKRLKEKIVQEKYADIEIRHAVTDNELFSLYQHACAFISPSYIEGFGLPPLEAMSASCPILVSDIPAFREVCQDVAFYFDPTDISALKKQLQFMYNLNQQTKQNHVIAGLARVKDFSWKKMAEKTLEIYKS